MPTKKPTPELAVQGAKDLTASDGFQQKIYQAISVQRPVVIEYLKSVRRDKPDATPAEILKELEKRYVATVTITSTGVGASAAIPAVGIPLALGLGMADLLFFYETSALFVLAATELHGIEVQGRRARQAARVRHAAGREVAEQGVAVRDAGRRARGCHRRARRRQRDRRARRCPRAGARCSRSSCRTRRSRPSPP